MSSMIADGVMAATYKLVQQAMTGQWQDVPKTVEERRVLLDRITATATPQDQQWLGALKQAMAESDAAVAKMTGQNVCIPTTAGVAAEAIEPKAASQAVDSMMEMIAKGR